MKILKEPLVQFVILGAVLAGLLALAPDQGIEREDRIVVTAEKIDHLAGLWTQTWKRPPTPQELDGLVRDHLREELAYREGLAVGMDRDDTIIRRRIRQKMEFIAEDVGALRTPTDEDLQAYLEAHAEKFRQGPSYSFRQVMFSVDRRGAAAEADTRQALVELRGPGAPDPATLGDGAFFQAVYLDQSERDIAANFGMDFLAGLEALAPGRWEGPVRSAYGLHAVIVDARADGGLPALDEVRAAVQREWEHAQKNAAVDLFYEELAKKYEITVEWDKILAVEETP